MIPIQTQEQPPAALLVYAPGTDGNELQGLTDTLGITHAASIHLTTHPAGAQYGLGTGKAAEIVQTAQDAGADCIIFDFPLTPTHQRNWERLAGIPVFDRHEVILRIFADRAQTKEAVLQVELAKLSYSLPRLAHMYGDMARQRGGNYGSKGSGETQLELDRRSVKERIAQVRKELAQVEKDRLTQRKKRNRIPLASCALVGYTNAGKSSLLNALTGSSVLAEDKLFATLDPSTRRLHLGNGGGILLTDTVGFIHNLPHTLIEAFKSTLEEACTADLLLVVLDSSDPAADKQYQTVISVLDEIGALSQERILVFNKIDCLEHAAIPAITTHGEQHISVSAKTGSGLAALTEAICARVFGPIRTISLPLSSNALITEIRRTGIIYQQEWASDSVQLTARVPSQILAQIKSYLVH